MTIVRDSALEWLQRELEKKDADNDSLAQDLIEMTLRAEAAEAQLARVMADREVSV